MKVRYRSRLAKLILPKRYTAITLGSRVFTPLASLSAGTLRHERAHVEQWKRHGIARFPLLYFWYHLRHGYERNPFEMEAHRRSRQPARRRPPAAATPVERRPRPNEERGRN
jgi:hypothetical protein